MARQLITDKYKRYLLLEKGLSPNTMEAYWSDLQKLLYFCEERKLSILTLKQKHLEDFWQHCMIRLFHPVLLPE